jgi:predicted metalloprotease
MSPNIEDRRGGGGAGFGGFGGRGLGLGGVIVALVLSVIFGQDFFSMLGLVSGGGAPATSAPSDSARTRQEEPEVQFVSFVLDDTQQTWHRLLVLFRDEVQSACGYAQAATGPFYCPGDQRVYIDLEFFDELQRRFQAPGDFARAYVLAHEIGHHVQTLLGVQNRVRQLQRANPEAQNALSVRMELQADCLAGVWGHSTRQRGILEEGDIEEGLNAAAAVGDDRIQKMARGRVSPESFTHGSSAQRMQWFRRGFESGDVNTCDTFRDSGGN